MKMRKSSLLVLVLALLLLITGCEEKETLETKDENINVGRMQHKHCTRGGNADNATVNLNYDLYYTGENLNALKSVEQIVSDNSDTLTTYENAYKKIHGTP